MSYISTAPSGATPKMRNPIYCQSKLEKVIANHNYHKYYCKSELVRNTHKCVTDFTEKYNT